MGCSTLSLVVRRGIRESLLVELGEYSPFLGERMLPRLRVRRREGRGGEGGGDEIVSLDYPSSAFPLTNINFPSESNIVPLIKINSTSDRESVVVESTPDSTMNSTEEPAEEHMTLFKVSSRSLESRSQSSHSVRELIQKIASSFDGFSFFLERISFSNRSIGLRSS